MGINFKGHFGVIWMDGASNNVLAGKMLESLHGVPEYPWLCVEWCTPHLAMAGLGNNLVQVYRTGCAVYWVKFTF